MPALCELSIDQLLPHCGLPLPSRLPQGEAAWQELQRRALSGNDRAWDALVGLLWPALLGWIYQQLPDRAPILVAELAQCLLLQFKRRQSHGPSLLTTVQLVTHFQGNIGPHYDDLWTRMVGKTDRHVSSAFPATPTDPSFQPSVFTNDFPISLHEGEHPS